MRTRSGMRIEDFSKKRLLSELTAEPFEQIFVQLDGQFRGKLYGQIREQISGQIRGKLSEQLQGQLNDQLYRQLLSDRRG